MILAAGIIYTKEFLESLSDPANTRAFFYADLSAFLVVLFVIIGMYCEKKNKERQEKEEREKAHKDRKIKDQ